MRAELATQVGGGSVTPIANDVNELGFGEAAGEQTDVLHVAGRLVSVQPLALPICVRGEDGPPCCGSGRGCRATNGFFDHCSGHLHLLQSGTSGDELDCSLEIESGGLFDRRSVLEERNEEVAFHGHGEILMAVEDGTDEGGA